MSCDLNRFTNYSLGQVVHDSKDGRITVQLVDPPASCPDRSFTTHKGKLVVQDGVQPVLTYSATENKPIIVVPRKEYVQEVEHPFSFSTLLLVVFILLMAGVAVWYAWSWFTEKKEKEEKDARDMQDWAERQSQRGLTGSSRTRLESSVGSYAGGVIPPERPLRSSLEARAEEYEQVRRPYTPPPSQNVVVQQAAPNNDGLLTGMVLGSMMSQGRDRTTIVERERVIEEPRHHHSSYRDDSDDSSSYSSDSNSSSFSSDSSSSSYSSDDSSSSSYSSDSGSSYSSDSSFDSGSSFSSDSGSSFSGD